MNPKTPSFLHLSLLLAPLVFGATGASASDIALNFGAGGHAAETGYDTVPVAIIAAVDSPGTQALGTFDGVDVSVAKDGTIGRLRSINRTSVYNPGDGALANLCDSWIGTEAAPDAMIVILSGVSVEDHTWTSYHVDESNQNATMEVSLSTDGGSTFTVIGSHKIKATTYDSPVTSPNPFSFSFVPQAGQDVHVKFVTTANGNAGAGGDFTILNGFDLALTPPPAETAKFDVNNGASGNTQLGWTAAPNGAGTDGTVTMATTAIGGAAIAARDRGTGATDGPGGDVANNGMWRDFIFANPSTGATPAAGVRVDLTGLAPSNFYDITVFAYDPLSGGLRAADWSDGIGGAAQRLTFAGAAANDPTSLADNNVTFTVFSDPAGAASFEGLVSATSPNGTGPNVFLNGVIIGLGEPDLDLDGLPDSFEQLIIDADGGDAINTINDVNPGDDFDSDDSTNANEFGVGTDPIDPDTDNDGALDGHETNTGSWTSATNRGTDPFDDDTDADGLLDGVENRDLLYDSGNPTTQPGTDPHLVDTDGDGRTDAQEVNSDGTDPTDINDFLQDYPDATAKFDFNDGVASPTQFDWTPAPLGAGADGGVSITTTALGVSATLDTRDRNNNTDGPGADTPHADLWRDFVFSNGSFASDPTAGLQVDISGLAPNTGYSITVAGYDQGSSATTRSADWSQVGCSPFETQSFGGGGSTDPTAVTDDSATFEILTDGSGAASIQGIVAATSPSASHNVFVNYLVIGAATAPSGTRDCDGDGRSDLLDIAMGFDAFVAETPGLLDVSGGVINNHGEPTTVVENVANGVDFSVIFARRDDLAALGLSIGVQFSHNLTTWFPGDAGSVIGTGPGLEAVEVQYPFFLPNGRKARFWQLVVTVL